MPWEYVGSDEAGYVRKFVDDRGFIHDDAAETHIRSEDSCGEYYTPVTTDKKGRVLK